MAGLVPVPGLLGPWHDAGHELAPPEFLSPFLSGEPTFEQQRPFPFSSLSKRSVSFSVNNPDCEVSAGDFSEVGRRHQREALRHRWRCGLSPIATSNPDRSALIRRETQRRCVCSRREFTHPVSAVPPRDGSFTAGLRPQQSSLHVSSAVVISSWRPSFFLPTSSSGPLIQYRWEISSSGSRLSSPLPTQAEEQQVPTIFPQPCEHSSFRSLRVLSERGIRRSSSSSLHRHRRSISIRFYFYRSRAWLAISRSQPGDLGA
ncbi:succinate dehydrogenase or fumarate reductase [Striga asiatica]|uniref:Succinate dehydrogenase or fumarate reductase n=1 Tax=Striga asiatica TaxID=4170 RepID=A0A5A7PXB2_STRAF|nr:succinate dehydrogenase or fumarate reductase [Striga asiatica]